MGQMFDARCVKELFRPQQAFSKKSLRTVFDRLAHASIMKLNTTAMDKVTRDSYHVSSSSDPIYSYTTS